MSILKVRGFSADINHDGMVTISDIYLYPEWWLNLPGNIIVSWLYDYLQGFILSMSRFFESPVVDATTSVSIFFSMMYLLLLPWGLVLIEEWISEYYEKIVDIESNEEALKWKIKTIYKWFWFLLPTLIASYLF